MTSIGLYKSHVLLIKKATTIFPKQVKGIYSLLLNYTEDWLIDPWIGGMRRLCASALAASVLISVGLG